MVRYVLGLMLLASCAWVSDAERALRMDGDLDGVERPEDCDDSDPAVRAVRTWYADADGDGFGAGQGERGGCTAAPGFALERGDCDDADPLVFPGAEERCNGIDDDCDAVVDDDVELGLWFADGDGDGFGTGEPAEACTAPAGHVADGGDCDDLDPAVHPAALEVCNGIDDDCDARVDLEDASLDLDSATWHPDADADGYGDADIGELACPGPPGLLADGTDCDDSDPAAHPGAVETCDGDDDDCDGTIDEDDAVDAPRWYADGDGDGFGDALLARAACLRPLGHVGNPLDCNDTDPLDHPAGAERCDGRDNDCDGLTDDDDPDAAGLSTTWYRDADADGYGIPSVSTLACSPPVGFAPFDTDCDDTEPLRSPGEPERCDGLDNDCDGLVDDDDDDVEPTSTPTWYADADGDGFGDAGRPSTGTCTGPPGSVLNGLDCDDTDPTSHPGAQELCSDGRDNNCNGQIDEAAPWWFADGDGDGYGVTGTGVQGCTGNPGDVLIDGDCDDADPARAPGLPETCDGVDNDCDALTDDDDPDVLGTPWYADADADGFGDPFTSRLLCAPRPGWVLDATDCSDELAAVFPGATEVCDGLDNDCDGGADDNDPEGAGAPTWFADGDNDGFGNPSSAIVACIQPPQHTLDGSDCNDADPAVAPSAPEVCNGGIDDDCDGHADDDDLSLEPLSATTWYADLDEDTWGDATQGSLRRCTQPPRTADRPGDCDDREPLVNPGQAELCDGLDNDCDTEIDEETPTLWYLDGDGDGYGDPTESIPDCDPVPGYVTNPDDCDDSDPYTNPGQVELCGGGDENCNGLLDEDDPTAAPPLWFEDIDADGFGVTSLALRACAQPTSFAALGGDCDDREPSIHPGAIEICNALDDDCDGLSDDDDPDATGLLGNWVDLDGDGYGDPALRVDACVPPPGFVADDTDCDDTDRDVHPAADERCDGADNDCDGDVDDDDPSVVDRPTWYRDADGDRHGTPLVSGPACVQPPGTVALGDDCDDADPWTYLGAPELCDGIDNDCDTVVDEAATVDRSWYPDGDGDGFGDPNTAVLSCSVVPGHVLYGTDCDDIDPAVHPEAPEDCDGIDNDCDLLFDDADPDSTAPVWFADTDGDTFGDAANTLVRCVEPLGFTADDTDCDDGDPAVFPGAVEVAGDERDEDCDGTILCWLDADMDGSGGTSGHTVLDVVDGACLAIDQQSVTDDDCDDGDPAVHPGAPEVCGDGVDNDCDGTPGTCGAIAGDIDLAVSSDALDKVALADRGGASVAAGDLDGDGLDDLIVGAPWQSAGGAQAGAAFVLYGPISTPDTLLAADVVLGGEAAGDELGTAVAFAGDVDGDGRGDLLLAAPWHNAGAGAVYLQHGPPPSGTLSDLAATKWAGAALGGEPSAVAGGGDMDGDGLDDVLVGVPKHLGRGEAYLIRGPATTSGPLNSVAHAIFLASGVEALGSAVAVLPDLTGDGLPDAGVGAPKDRGAVYVFALRSGPSSSTTADATVMGAAVGEEAGWALAGGDLDGDGDPDLLVGGPGATVTESGDGRIALLAGPLAGSYDTALDAVATLHGAAAGDAAGSALEVADLDGDGAVDVLVGVPAAGGGSGRAYLVYGPLAGTLDLDGADVRVLGFGTDQAVGRSVTSADHLGGGARALVVGSDSALDLEAAWVFGGTGW